MGQGRAADGRTGPGPSSPLHLVILGGLLLAFALLVIVTTYYWTLRPLARSPISTPSSPDPRLAYTGPFRNVDPAVRYVEEERCAGCHEKEAGTYAHHPMGRSLVPVARPEGRPEGAREPGAFRAFGLQFRIECDGDRVRHRQLRLDAAGRPLAEQAWQVD